MASLIFAPRRASCNIQYSTRHDTLLHFRRGFWRAAACGCAHTARTHCGYWNLTALTPFHFSALCIVYVSQVTRFNISHLYTVYLYNLVYAPYTVPTG